jgi:hypothetical protein
MAVLVGVYIQEHIGWAYESARGRLLLAGDAGAFVDFEAKQSVI